MDNNEAYIIFSLNIESLCEDNKHCSNNDFKTEKITY